MLVVMKCFEFYIRRVLPLPSPGHWTPAVISYEPFLVTMAELLYMSTESETTRTSSYHIDITSSYHHITVTSRYEMTNYFRHYQLRILTTTNEDNKLCVIKDGLSFIRTDDSTHFAAKARIILNACLLCIYLLLTLCWRLCLVSMVSLRCSAHYCSL